MRNGLRCFKAYDIRGQVPTELNEDLAYQIGRCFVYFMEATRVVVGHDARLSSPALAQALCRGLLEAGADVYDIGLSATEEVYFATIDRDLDGGIAVTASHNPKDHNGLKLVGQRARPISQDTGLLEIEQMVMGRQPTPLATMGKLTDITENRQRLSAHLLGYLNAPLRPLKIVVNAGNGTAGMIIDTLEPHLPFDFIKLNHEPDGRFPNGIPNPLLPECRADTAAAVKANGADFGVAWDGDADRCFFFDERGEFVEGYYVVGVLGEEMLQRSPGGKVIYDPRLVWNTIDAVTAAGGIPVQSRSGHAFIKDRMRLEDAVYGGEMSAHHYFRDFGYCDSGMIPWLLVAQRLCHSGQRMSEVFSAPTHAFPCSGEINFQVTDPEAVIATIVEHYSALEPELDRTDGIGLSFDHWRMNLRASNTEPLLRLNVESRADKEVLRERTSELIALISKNNSA